MRLTNVENRQRRLLLIGLTVARREHRIDPCGYLNRIASTRLSSSLICLRSTSTSRSTAMACLLISAPRLIRKRSATRDRTVTTPAIVQGKARLRKGWLARLRLALTAKLPSYLVMEKRRSTPTDQKSIPRALLTAQPPETEQPLLSLPAITRATRI